MDRSVVWLITCSDMAYYLAGCAILYALDPGPTMEILEILGGRVEEAGSPPQKGSDSACPLEAAVGLVLESHQRTPPQASFPKPSLS